MKREELATILEIPELPDYLERVDHELEQAIISDNSSLATPALRIAQAGGKRLRPAVAIAAATSHGEAINESLIAACASVELLHLASLVHDDIIDDSDERRGVRTINGSEGISTAILVGDYLLAMAGVQAARAGKEVAEVTASAFAAMCDGQNLEMADTYNADRTVASYTESIRKKTAVLIAAACRIGGICGGLPEKSVNALGDYGEAFGMSFQLADDVMDILATSEELGKPAGNDLKEGVYTLPILLALRGPSADVVRPWLRKTPAFNPGKALVANTLIKDGSIERTIQEVRGYNKKAVEALNELEDTSVVRGLARLPDAYLEQALSKQTILKVPA